MEERARSTPKKMNWPAFPIQIRQNLVWAGAVVASLCLHLIAYLDVPIARYARTINPAVVSFFKKVTVFGDSLWYLLPALIFYAAYRVGSVMTSRMPRKDRFRRYSNVSLFIFVSIAGAGLTTDLLKIIFGRARPKILVTGGQDIFSYFRFSSSYWSFPSGHANTFFAVMTTLWILVPRGRWIYLPLAIMGASSRVIVGKHYPSDVLAGAFLGVLVTLYVRQVFLNRERGQALFNA